MGSEHIKLLRRPLPPKKLQPLHRPFRKTFLSDPSVESLPSGSIHGIEWSFYDTSLWDFNPELSYIIPVPLYLLAPDSPPLPHEITNSFPSRPQRTFSRPPILDLLKDQPRFAPPPPCFLLNDFMEAAQSRPELVGRGRLLRKTILSRCNYRKLVDMFLSEIHSGHQCKVANQILSSDEIPPASRRIPERQIIYELAAQVRMELRAQMLCVRHFLEEPLSQFQQNSLELWKTNNSEHVQQQSMYPMKEVILSSFPVKHFQGSCRSSSPFHPSAECVMISLSELAILECLSQRSKALSLKAHFISQLPELSPLVQSLLYLNLSFNDFTVFPVEVCDLVHLEVLKLRDNPIEEIPANIENLHNLKTLVISFCKITTLPSQLYHLPFLKHLDMSHNLISSISSEIKNLRSLQCLNLEGNQLEALPAGVLSLSLTELRLSGNYTHPLLWSRNTVNTPPSLTHSAAHTLAHTHPQPHYSNLPAAAQTTLNRCV
ncbi:uncharacterized protein [Hoplias malabaricus]|uniref:uncharacterized protein isoform X2 n=1 Tax=Hoplias malabaricus TaxID=27720 RepID=UPI003461BD64